MQKVKFWAYALLAGLFVPTALFAQESSGGGLTTEQTAALTAAGETAKSIADAVASVVNGNIKVAIISIIAAVAGIWLLTRAWRFIRGGGRLCLMLELF